MTTPAPRSARYWSAAALALVLAKLWLTRGQTLCALAGPGTDDSGPVVLAQALAQGDWAQVRLLPASGGWLYPAWIAANYWLGLPLLLANQLAHATAAWLGVRALRPGLSSAAGATLLFAALLWYPVSFDASALSRTHPAQLHGPLTLLLFAGALGLALRPGQSFRQLWPWAVLSGLAGAGLADASTRSWWVLPPLTMLAGWSLHAARRISLRATRAQAAAWLLGAGLATALTLVLPDLNAISTTPPRSSEGFWSNFLGTADFIASSRNFSAHTPPSAGSDAAMQLFRDLTREKLAPRPGDNPPTGPAQGQVDLRRTDTLRRWGKSLRPVLLTIFLLAHLPFAWGLWSARARRRREAWPMLALVVWLALLSGILSVASLGTPTLPACAALYPLVPLFAGLSLAGLATSFRPAKP